MRLIDADALKARMIAFMTGASTTYLVAENIMMMINQADTVDAVPVMRCKDCKHWEPYGNLMNRRTDGTCLCLCKYHDAERPATEENHYCAYGESH